MKNLDHEALCTRQLNYQEKFTADRASERSSEIFNQVLQLVLRFLCSRVKKKIPGKYIQLRKPLINTTNKRRDTLVSQTYFQAKYALYIYINIYIYIYIYIANISGLLRTRALTTLSHGESFHQAPPTIAQVKDAIFALRRNFS